VYKFDYELFVYENRGRDVLLFYRWLNNIDLETYPFPIFSIAHKKSPPVRTATKVAGNVLVSRVAPNSFGLDIGAKCARRQSGFCRAQRSRYFDGNVLWREQEKREWLASDGIENIDPNHDRFIAGTMFVRAATHEANSCSWIETGRI